jgi:hypothetical protein
LSKRSTPRRAASERLFRPIDSAGGELEFRANIVASCVFIHKEVGRHRRPEQIIIDGSQTNRAIHRPQR